MTEKQYNICDSTLWSVSDIWTSCGSTVTLCISYHSTSY